MLSSTTTTYPFFPEKNALLIVNSKNLLLHQQDGTSQALVFVKYLLLAAPIFRSTTTSYSL